MLAGLGLGSGADIGASRTGASRRDIVLDLVWLLVIANVFWFIHVPLVFHGMAWGDPSWYFHFGRRVLHGAVPYRDFVFQVGPLPIYVDAAAQKLFGEGYSASLIAGVSVKLLRVALTFLIARRLSTSRFIALGVVTFLTFERVWYSFANHWSLGYTQISLLACTYFFILAHHNVRRRGLYVILAGASLALMVTARQSNAMIGALMMLVALPLVSRMRVSSWLSNALIVRFWIGYAIALGLVALWLASMHALGPAVQQMFLDAAQKKNVGGGEAILDAISGGWATQPKYETTLTTWSSFVRFQLLPLVVAGGVVVALAQRRTLSSSSASTALALFVLPIAYLCSSSIGALDVFGDLPRTFITLSLLWLVLSPDRAERAFGLSKELLLVILALPLAMEVAMQLSFPGRGWGEAGSMMTAMFLLAAATRRVSLRLRTSVMMVLGLIAIGQFIGWRKDDLNPFAKFDYFEGTVAETHVVMPENKMLNGMKINESRARILGWLGSHVKPGDTCFVYGSMPALYDLLDCTNPSMLDTTAADFFTGADGDRVTAALQKSPPKFIIAQEGHWMNPDLEVPFTGDEGLYAGLNPKASKSLHLGVQSILPLYELLEPSKSQLTPNELAQAEKAHDHIERLRLYRLRVTTLRGE